MIKVANIYFHDLTWLLNFHLVRLTKNNFHLVRLTKKTFHLVRLSKNMFLKKKSRLGALKNYFQAVHCLSNVKWEIILLLAWPCHW